MRVKRNGAPVATTGAANNKFNQQRNSITPEPYCEHFGAYELVSSMRCINCPKSEACTLRHDSQVTLERGRKRKAAKSLARHLTQNLGYPIREAEAYAREVHNV